MAEHIAYDTSSFRASLAGTAISASSATAASTLRNRSSVCSGYAELFQQLGHHAGLDVKIVRGYGIGWTARYQNEQPEENHAWNAVRINGRWHLLDVTWAAGRATADLTYVRQFDDAYFFTDPQQFFVKHKPNVAIWSLLTGDTFEAPATEGDANRTFGVQLVSPLNGDISIKVGERVTVEYVEDKTLVLGGWVSAVDDTDLMGPATRHVARLRTY